MITSQNQASPHAAILFC